MLRIKEIWLDNKREPVGTQGFPSFRWVMESDKKNVMQSAYSFVVREAHSDRMIYESGWVESARSVEVTPEEELDLRSLTKYSVSVKVRAGEEESLESPRSYFITGILDKKEWKADFISAESREDKDNSQGTCLKKKVMVSGDVESAYVCTTALGLYHFYINGNKIGEDELTPGWTSYQKHLCYQTYDVTDAVRQGENELGAMVGAGWYKGKMGFLHLRNNYGEQTAFLMQLLIRYHDGREEVIVTDISWEGQSSPVLFSEIYDGESYDARRELYEAKKLPVSVIEFPKDVLTAQPGGRVKKMEELSVRKLIVTPEGDTVLDFGQNLTGWVEFQIRADRGEEVVLQCFETLDARGNVYTDNLRTAKQTIRYLCNGRDSVYHPNFTFQGFRYVKICQWPISAGPVAEEAFKACVLYSEMEPLGSFSCSNPLVNQLHHNILWGLKGNFVDIPTDCPQRDERMGWTGDAQIFCRTSCYLMNTDVFFSKWLLDVAADQTEEGGVPHVVPDIISGKKHSDWLLSQGTHSAAAWADVAVINPWTLYLMYGDREILERQYDSMKKWILFMKDHSRDSIWNYKLQLGDWVALDAEEGSYFGATPNDLTCTAYYANSTGLFAKIAGVLHRTEDEKEFTKLYQVIVEKFQSTFFQEDGSMTAQTQTAHIVALYFGLVPQRHRKKTADRLAELLEENGGHLLTGFVGTPYFCHALSENGYTREAYKLLLKEDFPSWLYQIKMGATTVWEHWDGIKPDGTMWSSDMNSFNHYAYGAVGDWLYRVVLGIEPDEHRPGFQHILIKPQTDKALAYAEGSYQSFYGEIAVRWEKENNKTRLFFHIPVNTRATLLLEQGAENISTKELSVEKKGDRYQAECGSGDWTVEYTIEE